MNLITILIVFQALFIFLRVDMQECPRKFSLYSSLHKTDENSKVYRLKLWNLQRRGVILCYLFFLNTKRSIYRPSCVVSQGWDPWWSTPFQQYFLLSVANFCLLQHFTTVAYFWIEKTNKLHLHIFLSFLNTSMIINYCY